MVLALPGAPQVLPPSAAPVSSQGNWHARTIAVCLADGAILVDGVILDFVGLEVGDDWVNNRLSKRKSDRGLRFDKDPLQVNVPHAA